MERLPRPTLLPLSGTRLAELLVDSGDGDGALFALDAAVASGLPTGSTPSCIYCQYPHMYKCDECGVNHRNVPRADPILIDPQVFQLADSVATDSKFSVEGSQIFKNLNLANDDCHPDAHACRLKISLVTLDSGSNLPWDLTLQASKLLLKIGHVNANCRLALE